MRSQMRTRSLKVLVLVVDYNNTCYENSEQSTESTKSTEYAEQTQSK
ncbi:hypothetical protein HMPREF0424_0337 [Gardnerella vaginalis 409-05]|nr:hypothetical protein HMPREF0424_0337 [Gardnerella vaginalis 409-05]